MAAAPGILFVTMQPSSDLPIAQFHDWYNNEHGPTRLRLPFIENGFRYRALDLESPGAGTSDLPEWLAIYDITDMHQLTSQTYTRLREADTKSQREKDVMGKIKVGRKLHDLVSEKKGQEFAKLEEVVAGGREGNVLVAVSLTLKDGKDAKELDRWYNEEHIDLLSKVSGWQRTRRFVTSSILEGKEGIEYLALHEYAPKNGLGGEKFEAATSTSWTKEIMTNVVEEKKRRVYELYYIFSAAPRHLSQLSSFISPDGRTRTIPAGLSEGAAIESYVTSKDGVILPYRLEGSSDPNGPCIVLSNSILVDWGIWDGFIKHFLSFPENKKYRILRYLTRGRSSNFGTKTINMNVLASDITALLDALRIPKAAALVGVSLGGATVLNTALRDPGKVASFISCDTSSKSPEGNSRMWEERTLIAEKEGATAETGESIVGEQLAGMTVRRWFCKESYDGGEVENEIQKVKKMVAGNDLCGFKKSVEALFDYDMREEMKKSLVRGMFVVGSGDEKLPGTMKEMAGAYGGGAEFTMIDGAGHLPMVEKPEIFAEVVTNFLSKNS